MTHYERHNTKNPIKQAHKNILVSITKPNKKTKKPGCR